MPDMIQSVSFTAQIEIYPQRPWIWSDLDMNSETKYVTEDQCTISSVESQKGINAI